MHFVLKTHCLNVFRKADGAMTRDWNRKKKRRRIFCLSEQAENNPVGFRECAHNMYTQHRNSTLQLMDTGHISFIELFFLKLKIITFIGRDCEPQPNPIWKWLNYQSVQQKKNSQKTKCWILHFPECSQHNHIRPHLPGESHKYFKLCISSLWLILSHKSHAKAVICNSWHSLRRQRKAQ